MLLLLCLLSRLSWLTVEGGGRLLHRRGGRAVVAMSVGVAGDVPMQNCRGPVWAGARLPLLRETRSEVRPPRRSLFAHCDGPRLAVRPCAVPTHATRLETADVHESLLGAAATDPAGPG